VNCKGRVGVFKVGEIGQRVMGSEAAKSR
jgi:hypothetical protein